MTKTKSFWFLSSLFFIMLPMLWNYRSIISAPNTEWILEGRVYEGNQGEITRPLQGAWIEVYGVYGAYPTTGTLLRMVTTDAAGWYGISVYDTDGPFTHYYILAVDRPGYTSVSATTVGGLDRACSQAAFDRRQGAARRNLKARQSILAMAARRRGHGCDPICTEARHEASLARASHGPPANQGCCRRASQQDRTHGLGHDGTWGALRRTEIAAGGIG